MFSKGEILKKLHEHKDEMRIRISVSQIGLSGSYVHDTPREGSDIDRLLRLATYGLRKKTIPMLRGGGAKLAGKMSASYGSRNELRDN